VKRIRIGLHIEVEPAAAGGIAQSTQGLVSSLGTLDGPEQFVLVAQTPIQAEWIDQYRGANQKLVTHDTKPPRKVNSLRNRMSGRKVKNILRTSARAMRWLKSKVMTPTTAVPVSDGYYESLGCDVLHFPTQAFMLSSLPTVYNPHDLQHRHYPQFFSASELAWREAVHKTACQSAHTVVVGSNWIKQDVTQQYAVHPGKVQIIPWASPTAQYPQVSSEQVASVRDQMGLPATYALYPAVTWAHKNHVRLLEAIAALRDRRGLIVNLVCTGARGGHWPIVEQRIQDLNLGEQVRFLGFVSEANLRAVYRLAQFIVLPSLFEADSCPIHEAWSEGIPVASSNHTALPDQVGNAGLLFDANDVSAIAQALEQMCTDVALREQLVERGYKRVKDFDWSRTAKAYRAVYRRAAGAVLTEEDRWLLSWDWMREPDRSPTLDIVT
jgi:glycosyltransferase involved in cell wall biosynthesis